MPCTYSRNIKDLILSNHCFLGTPTVNQREQEMRIEFAARVKHMPTAIHGFVMPVAVGLARGQRTKRRTWRIGTLHRKQQVLARSKKRA